MSTGSPGAAFHTACSAPFLTLHLDPRGVVRACCENKHHVLGRIPQDRLSDIWRGERLERLRTALRHDDLTLGCDGCARAITVGPRGQARVGDYDADDVPGPAPAHPTRLELELSNACNLQCVMCNGELSSSIRIHREGRPALPQVYDEAFFDELAQLLPHLHHVQFLGGEPFLGREPRRVFDLLRSGGFTGRVHVTTNGTVLDERVRTILEDLRVDLSVSVDGIEARTVEAIRVGVDHAELLRNTEELRAICRRRGTTFALHFCLQPSNWRELRRFLAWGDRLDCDVIVLPVQHPMTMSLDRLPPDELARVVDGLRAEAVTATPLTRNAAVWEVQLARLVEQSERAGAVAHDGADPELVAELHRELVAWAGQGGWATLEIRPAGVVHRIVDAGTGAEGPDLARALAGVPGSAVQDILHAVVAAFGELRSSTAEPIEAGVERRTLRFRQGTVDTTVRAVLITPRGAGSPMWHLAARRDADG